MSNHSFSKNGSSIVCVVGARPNFIKIAPILRAFQSHSKRWPVRLVHTGQHYDEEMSGKLFRDLGLPDPDINLEVGSAGHAAQTAEVMIRFDRYLETEPASCVLVVGDVNSTLACSLVAVKRDVPVFHVESGLRSCDKKMPEEINRILTDQIATRLYTTERGATANLVREGIDIDSIRFVGNVMIDTLLYSKDRLVAATETLQKSGFVNFVPHDGRFAVATFHRPSNVDDRLKLETLLSVLSGISENILVVFVLHPRTKASVERFGFNNLLKSDRLAVLTPKGYLEMLGLMASASFVITDSGGIQEETTALGVPCLTLRENTERPVTVEQGTNTLLPLDIGLVLSAVAEILSGKGKRGQMPELWDGFAARRIVDDIFQFLDAQYAIESKCA